jgi:hypothetical protein
MAVIVQDSEPLARDRAKRVGELGARDRCVRKLIVVRIDHVNRQYVLPLVRTLFDLAAVPRVIQEDGRVRVATPLEGVESRADVRLCGILIQQDRHLLRVIPGEFRIDECGGQVLDILDLGKLADIRIVGDADDQGMGVFDFGRRGTLRVQFSFYCARAGGGVALVGLESGGIGNESKVW